MEQKLTIDRFEGDLAVLITEDKKSITWPKDKLPKSAKEGAVLSFYITNDINKSETDRKLAKNILNEILNPMQ
jgi:hypothetical protein